MKRATTTMTMTITGLRDDEELSSSSKKNSKRVEDIKTVSYRKLNI